MAFGALTPAVKKKSPKLFIEKKALRRRRRPDDEKPHVPVPEPGGFLLFAVGLALLASGCATTVRVTSPGCEVVGEINTGTEVVCSDGGVLVRRTSASEVTNGALGAAVNAAVKVLVP
jgi:hypothetical protein